MGLCSSTDATEKKSKPKKAQKKAKKGEHKSKSAKVAKSSRHGPDASDLGSSAKNLDSSDLLAIANSTPKPSSCQGGAVAVPKGVVAAPVTAPRKSVNPLASPDSQSLSSSSEIEGVLTEEASARKTLMELRERQLLMHRSDFTKRLTEYRLLAELQDPGDDDDEQSSSGRKCSMTPKDTELAADTGRDFTPASRSLEPLNPKNAHIPTARANVQRHSTEDDLWVVIRNRVYNLSGFQGLHPGGSWVLMQVAGQDATSTFEQQHSATYVGQLREYYVGDVPPDERR